MNIRKIVAEAQTYVSKPHRIRHGEFVVYAPYRDSRSNGPTTEWRGGSYNKALLYRARRVACIALHMAEIPFDEWDIGRQQEYKRVSGALGIVSAIARGD